MSGPHCQIQVVFKKFKIDAENLVMAVNPSNPDSIRGNKERAEDITKGYVYIFTRYSRPTGQDWPSSVAISVESEEHKITAARQSVCIPSTGVRSRSVYYAYSGIKLAAERVENIREAIKAYKQPGSPPPRVVQINSQQVLRPRPETPVVHTPLSGGRVKIEIVLHDWHGYLERFAQRYYDIVNGSSGKLNDFLDREVNLSGAEMSGSGLPMRALFAFTTIVDALIKADHERTLQGRASNLFGTGGDNRHRTGNSSIRRELADNARPMYNFFDRATSEFEYARSRPQAEELNGISANSEFVDGRSDEHAEELNGIIRIIPALLFNFHANSTFLDYMYGSRDEVMKLIAAIANCLYRWETTLHGHEKERLLSVWRRLRINADSVENLIAHMRDNNPVTAAEVHGLIGEVSVYLYIAAGVGVESGEAPEDVRSILFMLFSVEHTNNNRLRLHYLLAYGALKENVSMQAGVMYETSGGRSVSFSSFGKIVTLAGKADDLGVFEIPRIASGFLGSAGTVVEFHNFAVQMAMATQMLQNRQIVAAVPHFLSASEISSLAVAARSGFAVGAFLSAARVWLNAGRAFSAGEIAIGFVYSVSGIFFLSSGAILGGQNCLLRRSPPSPCSPSLWRL